MCHRWRSLDKYLRQRCVTWFTYTIYMYILCKQQIFPVKRVYIHTYSNCVQSFFSSLSLPWLYINIHIVMLKSSGLSSEEENEWKKKRKSVAIAYTSNKLIDFLIIHFGAKTNWWKKSSLQKVQVTILFYCIYVPIFFFILAMSEWIKN